MSFVERSAWELLQLLDQGKASSVELTQVFLHEIEASDKQIGAFLRVESKSALQRAAEIDHRHRAEEKLGKLASIQTWRNDRRSAGDVLGRPLHRKCQLGRPTRHQRAVRIQQRRPAIGLQLQAAPLAEETLLRGAHMYEQATDWNQRRPPYSND